MTDRMRPLLVLTIILGLGFTGVFIKLAAPVSPANLFATRSLISFALFALVIGLSPARRLVRVDRRSWTYAGPGVLLACYYYFAAVAFQQAPVAVVSLILATAPVFGTLYGAMLGHAPGRWHYLGMALCLAGLAVTVSPDLAAPPATGPATTPAGLAAALASAAGLAGYGFLSRRLTLPGGAAGDVTLVIYSLFGASLLGLVALAPGELAAISAERPTTLVWLLGLSVVATLVPTVALALLSQRVSPVSLPLTNLPVPLVAALVAFLVLGEALPATFVPGAGLVVVGLYFLVVHPARRTRGGG
ncbi:EamA-like transporter family protein [Rhodothalassium salexigens DSM 2132]|uniref:EamA-like transporter family protein n=1 Tax=Rhodothalassium salexigens DSM 2132 TaxID=1188247 RepID=A0A4R2PIS4_RHOSA|nr:EamA family transporter [Rhodothalassium salexigens]MBB4211859.1 drug/metabolite transporter (DMT)-like permease [Rhodothalassium salexigens DSM 2132]MBK1638844.1 hypothetical protein [Rhodothalassium salexigens DSM 2132]TCP33845.1 EamA-like transporter family protein [Rhodothalassium salexigens DSM 2132]